MTESPIMMTNTRELPSLAGITRLGIDTETTTGKDFWSRQMVGVSYHLPDGRQGYLPLRHPGGGNYPEERAREWARGELRDKDLVGANVKHEAEIFHRWGVDLEAQGCRMHDVFNQAALLNDNRKTVMACSMCDALTPAGSDGCAACGSAELHSLGRLNLRVLAREDLNRRPIEADHTMIWQMTAAQAAPIAVEDAELAWALDQTYRPRIAAEELDAVLELEDGITFAVAEMERNGTYLDVEKLARWDVEIAAEHEARLLGIHRATGLKINPGSWKDMRRLFQALNLEHPYTAPTEVHPDGCPSFGEEFLATVEHPTVRLALEAAQLASLRSKYTAKYLRAVSPSGLLRYQLHQLAGDRYGTITGRFSSSNVNIQQVSVKKKQPALTQRWPIRELFIPPAGHTWVSADASQIEFRIFAHYAYRISRRLADAYNNDPTTDFHNLVMGWVNLIRDHTKNVNFCKLYGGGAHKVALMCKVSEARGEEIVEKYDREFPEARRLIKMASDQAERLGYVRTFIGRRRRYPPGGSTRFYSALNAVFQGTAADIMKRKVREVHRERKTLDLTQRFTVHDEFDGSTPDPGMTPRYRELLNEQTTPLRVPITWEVGTGKNWQEAH